MLKARQRDVLFAHRTTEYPGLLMLQPRCTTVPRREFTAVSLRARKRLVALAVAGSITGLLFAMGPRVDLEDRWAEPTLPVDIDSYLERAESGVPNLRPGDHKSVVWSDPDAPGVTPLALVYLHGFSADRHEIEPLISDLASDIGANVYFARLAGHGRDGPAMGEPTAEDWLDDTAEAIAIGGYIGERVVLVGTSTGGTLALWGAARPEAQGRVAALVLVSPNLGLQDRAAPLLLWPWGGALARMVVGSERCFVPQNDGHARHWTTCYPTGAILQMAALVERVRSLEPGVLDVPSLVVYSQEDAVVDPNETDRVMARLSVDPPALYVVEGSGDAENHVIAGDVLSPGTTGVVRRRIVDFLEQLREPAR
jgi:alpha-beta hydrolase superfamily lysophospholipase